MGREKIWHLFARKLTGEASAEELQEFDLLVKEDASINYELQTIAGLWNQENDADADYLEATYLLHYEKMKKLGIEPGNAEQTEIELFRQPSFYRRNRGAIFAAAIVTCLFFIVTILVQSKKRPGESLSTATTVKREITTKNGSNTQLKLPDGSTVWLNAGSKLNYEKISETGLREVYLTGEGFFDIVKNLNRPFIIHTSSIDVKVLGTKFNVKAYPDDKTVETSLIRGSVEVTVKNNPGEKYLLKPNQKLILANEAYIEKAAAKEQRLPERVPVITIRQLSYIKGDTAAVETAWVRNKLDFVEEPFANLAKRMERWYDVQFEFRNKNMEDEVLTGSFEPETLTEVLEALRFATNNKLNYRIEGKKILIF